MNKTIVDFGLTMSFDKADTEARMKQISEAARSAPGQCNPEGSRCNQPADFDVGTEGFPLTLDDLPDAAIRRWPPRRKAEVVTAVNDGRLSIADACLRYSLSVEEFRTWQRNMHRFGVEGLRVSRIQELTRNHPRP